MLAVIGQEFYGAGAMRPRLNATHDPSLRSWVDSANVAGTDFPLQNLPIAIFRRRGGGEDFRAGIAIGDAILDLAALRARCKLAGAAAAALDACAAPALNALMSQGPAASAALRAAVSELLRADQPRAPELRAALVPQSAAEYALPAHVGNYTDFYTSIYHATAVGKLARPDNPLPPNYRWMPIAYHGRASSVGVAPQEFHRPVGQSMPAGASAPVFGPSRRLDFELEVGLWIGAGNALGTAIPLARAEEHLFGIGLLNDWSARDVQGWEYQPLGPFLGKNFATTVSPWIVSLEALEPFRLPFTRPAEDPAPLAYLEDAANRARGALDLQLEVRLETARMRSAGAPPQPICRSNFRHAYWTMAQMVSHHTVGGCNLLPGDLLGSGTQSGPAAAEAGSLLELTAGGKRELALGAGETRRFLEDGDRVILRGWCEREGFVRIGLGEADGLVLPARTE
jgi:fumarylacetoacetase